MGFWKSKIGGITQKFKKIPLKEALIFVVVGCLLLALAFFVFRQDKETPTTTITGTDSEKRLTAILQEFDGLGNVRVMIGSTEEGEKSVVIVCDGQKDIRTIVEVREAAATVVGTPERNVKIYFK